MTTNTSIPLAVGSFKAQIELVDLEGNTGFLLNGIAQGDFSGFSVASAGDINGDGLNDLVIGAPGSIISSNTEDQSYMVFGSPLYYYSPIN